MKFLSKINTLTNSVTSYSKIYKNTHNGIDNSNMNAFSFVRRNFSKNNYLFVDLFLKNSSFSGKRLKMLNYCNLVSSSFFFNFLKKSKFLSNKFSNYNIFYNFSKSNEFFFDFNYILENVVSVNESIFTTKVIKVDKKVKKKDKSKFNLELKYLNRFKRQSSVIKSLNLYSNNFNYYRFNERLLTGLVTTLFEQRNSDLYKKKLYTYNMVLKKKSR